MRTALAGAAVLVLLLAGPARAGPAYGPVPPGLAAVLPDETDRALAAMALTDLEHADARTRARGRALLGLLGDAGLAAVAARLAEGAPPALRVELVQVVAESPHPEADGLLAQAAAEPGFLARLLAAEGLGRGRSAVAVPALAGLLADPVPAVRMAALRSLFAIEGPEAEAARVQAPRDRDPARLARRLRWHRRAGDAGPALLAAALAAWRAGETASLRLAAADYLTLPAAALPLADLRRVLAEMGQGPVAAALLRFGAGVPLEGYDPVEERRIAIEAFFTLLARPDLPADQRAPLVDLAVAWVADPVPMESRGSDPIPESALRRRLPDLGADLLLEPVLRRLWHGAFAEPRHGAILLRELGPGVALPVLRRLAAPGPRPSFASQAEEEIPRYRRMAAVEVLQEIGRIGDEALARALILEEAHFRLRVEALRALRRDAGPWVVPLLAEIVTQPVPELRSYALDVLERRPEPEARTVLVEDLFARMDRPHDRLRSLVARGDEAAFAVLSRALDDPRTGMRQAALSQFHRERNAPLCGATGAALLRAFEPDPRFEHEVQGYVHALLSTEPRRAVAWVRAAWDALPSDERRHVLLRTLQDTRGRAHEDAMDLALEKVAEDAPREFVLAAADVFRGPEGYHWRHRAERIGPFWRRLLDSDDVVLQRTALVAWDHPDAPPAADRLLDLLDAALADRAYPAEASSPESEHAFAVDAVKALAHQPWDAVEERLAALAIDPLADPDTRAMAAVEIEGRLTEAPRLRLLAWLEGTTPKGGAGHDAVQLHVAAAVGAGAGPEVASRLLEALRGAIDAAYDAEVLDAVVLEGVAAFEAAWAGQGVVALARGVAMTGHVPSVVSLLDLALDPRFARYARACVAHQAQFARPAGAGAAACTPTAIGTLSHDGEGARYWGMPGAIYEMLHETKQLEDDVLAAAFARALAAARAEGRLAEFPALYLYRVAGSLVEPSRGRKPEAAGVVLRYAAVLDRSAGAVHARLLQLDRDRLADAERFAEAARAQEEVVRLLVMGNHDDRRPGTWRRMRATQDALEGAATAREGDADRARRFFRRARLRGPDDPDVLNTCAWYRALAGYGLDQAEAEALRATRLEARVENQPTAAAADTLAYVLLLQGRAQEGLDVLGPHIGGAAARRDGIYPYRMAQLLTAVGALPAAGRSLIEALRIDPALARRASADPRLAPLLAAFPLESLAARAAAER